MRGKSAAVLTAIFILGSLLPLVPPAYATGPTLDGNGNGVCTFSANPSTCATFFTNNPRAGDLLMIAEIASGLSVPVTFSVGDSLGDSYTTEGTFCVADGNVVCSAISYTQLSSSNSVNIYVKETGATSGSINTAVEEWGGIPAPYTDTVGSGVCNSACSGSLATASTAFSGSTYVLFSFAYSAATGPWTAGSSFATDNGGTTYCSAGSVFCAENSITVTSPTTFPITSGAGPAKWNEVGIAVVPNTSSSTTTAACNFFQLQCWWFPALFMALYAGVLMLVAGTMSVTSKGRVHVFLSALTFGSLVLVILGIMNIVFPLMMLIINTAIVLRLRG